MSRDAVVLAFDSLAGLSYGDPHTRDAFIRQLAPFDTPANADDLCGSQSCCITATMAALLIAEVDGTVANFRGRASVDPLREPRAGWYDGPAYLQTLATQRGLIRRPHPGVMPDVRAGCSLVIGLGADVHGVMVTSDPDDEGWFATVEGGKLDPRSKHTGAKACTAITRDVRRLRQVGSVWRLYNGKDGDGRAVNFWFQAGDLPCVP